MLLSAILMSFGYCNFSREVGIYLDSVFTIGLDVWEELVNVDLLD